MKTANLNFLSLAEKVTLWAYAVPRAKSVLVSEVISRIAAAALLSLSAALDLAMHCVLLIPTVIYSIGKSIYYRSADFTLPWQHLQRIRNAIAPIVLGSAAGLIHPFAGIALSEPTDKHAALSLLYHDKTDKKFQAFCSPIHALSIASDVANDVADDNIDAVYPNSHKVLNQHHVSLIQQANRLEKKLQVLQGQEFIQSVSNLTLKVMGAISIGINNSKMSDFNKASLTRLSGVLVPVLSTIDLVISFVAQAILLVIGTIRFISGRGPIFTEVTTSPIAQITLLAQNILKYLGNLVGTLVWFVSPMKGLEVSLTPSVRLFYVQMKAILNSIKEEMKNIPDRDYLLLPILFGYESEHQSFTNPLATMQHKTYLLVEKNGDRFNLYWVDRPDIQCRKELTLEQSLDQVRHMFEERFPFMNLQRIMEYPVKVKKPKFDESTPFVTLAEQGNNRNCIVSNLFGAFEVIDRIQGLDKKITDARYVKIREELMLRYSFYSDDFAHFGENYSLTNTAALISKYPLTTYI